MADPFIAEIRAFGFNFAPYGWMLCQGQLLPISQYSTVFALVGTMYGGNGQTNFALPNLQGAALVSQGQGAGLSSYVVGETTGTSNVTLLSTEMPLHSHGADAKTGPGATGAHNQPVAGDYLSRFAPAGGGIATAYTNPPNTAQTMFSPQMIQVAGGSQPHNNQQPYLAMTYAIALQGIFPSRN